MTARKGEKPPEKVPCLHESAVFRVRSIPTTQLWDVCAAWRSKRPTAGEEVFAATVEAPVMGSDGVVETRTAEWLFGAVHVMKTSICLHLGADAFVNASPVLRRGIVNEFWFTRSDWDSKRERPVMNSSNFLISPMIFRGILESEAIHIRRNTSPINSETDRSKIEKRLRMIVDPKGYLEKDTCRTCRMSTAAIAEIWRGVTVLTVMEK